MEYSPPPLFKQGASARVKVIVFTLIAIGLLMVDARMRSLTMIRQAVGMALYPLQVAALLPRDAMYAVSDYFSSVSTLQKEYRALRNKQVANAQALQQGQELMAENAQLRVFGHQFLPLLQRLRIGHLLVPERAVFLLQRRDRGKIIGHRIHRVARQQRRHLQRIQRHADRLANHGERTHTRIDHQQTDRDQSEDDDFDARRSALLEERRRTVFHLTCRMMAVRREAWPKRHQLACVVLACVVLHLHA